MAKFLHIADIHLGNTQYHHPERQKDFFRALYEVVSRAIAAKVDFVLMAGDLFDRRNIEPNVLTQATVVLKELKDAGIPVVAIEGNHDRSAVGTVSWLRYLSEWGWFMLLEPEHLEDGRMVLHPWSEEDRRGGYVEIAGLRIIGARWYGASTASVIPPLADAIAALPPHPYQILMFHAGLDGYLDHYSGGITSAQLAPFRTAGVCYLALGHIHKRYEEDGWAYNPGSLESATVAEFAEVRGAYLVEVQGGEHTVTHLRHTEDFPNRPFQRIPCDLSGCHSPEEALEEVRRTLVAKRERFEVPPVVELTLYGALRFKRHELDLDAVEGLIQVECEPLLARIKYDAVPAEYAVAPGASVGVDRRTLETQVLTDLVARDARYQERAPHFARLVQELKNRAIAGDPADDIALYLDQTLEA